MRLQGRRLTDSGGWVGDADGGKGVTGELPVWNTGTRAPTVCSCLLLVVM